MYTVISFLHLDSKIAMAFNDPDPIVTKGSLSVDPCGAILNKCGPVQSIPPNTNAAPICP